MASATTPAHTITYEEWIRMPVATEGMEEVVNGEIRVMPPNKLPHPTIIQELTFRFALQLDKRDYEIVASTFGIVIHREPLQCRNPDMAIFIRATRVVIDGYYHSAPDLVIEVLSPSETRKQIEEKLRDYESIGVPEAWLVSPEARTVEVLLLDDGRLTTARIVASGELHPVRFPQAAIEVQSIWPD